MKIVKNLPSLVIAVAMLVTMSSCSTSDIDNYLESKNKNTVQTEAVTNSLGNTTEQVDTRIDVDKIEIYKTIVEREITIDESNLNELYENLEKERQHYDIIMRETYENYQNYTSEAISQAVLNTVKIYYDMIGLITPMYRQIENMPEETEEEIFAKIAELNKINDLLQTLNSNEHDSQWVWFGNQEHLDNDYKEDILMFSNLYNLIRTSGVVNESRMEKYIKELNDKLESIKNQEELTP